MEMESTRRSFDRSREQIKKPRLSADDQPNPNGRAFAPRPAPTAASAARFREIEGGYQPQALGQAQQQYQELVSQYKLAIGELTFNSKPIITNLTIIAGENLHAAKAIAATVCNNIIEVPSDQKLPSLYLLDSIVKNIGKDYIKHFAARLPEVFCKAYRQVDTPVHQSMRHLFGTWKGVFSPQCLQMIERELGFSAAVNGSSSGGVASRPDSQSQRAHSIHVNPKYLERQRIQQSTRGKGTASDTNVSTANSVEDVERPDRAVSVGAGRSWVDPLVKMQSIQRPQRGVLNEPVHGKKKVGASHGDFEYGSDVSRSTGRTSGMVTEQGLDNSWYGAGSRDPETLSTQRNGFNMKHGLPDYLAPKPANLPPTHSNARSGSGMSPSWKNSEEEEFMWETHSRLSDQDAANLSSNLRKDPWTPDDSDKMEFSLAEVGPRFDRETSFDSLSTEQNEYATLGRRLSSPWKLQELHPTDGSSINAVPSEDYLATIGGLATSASSSARFAVQEHTSPNVSSGPTGTSVQQKFSSAGIVSPSGQSPMHQHSPSPSSSIPSRFPHPKLQNSAEQEFSKTHSLSQPPYKASRYLESLLPSTVLSGNLPKFQPENLQAASSIMPTFQPGHQYPSRLPDSKEIEPARQTAKPRLPLLSRTPQSGPAASGNSDPIIAEPPEQSRSSLLASVMKTGILSNIVSSGLPNPTFQDVGPLSSQLSTQTSRPSRPSTSQFPSSGSMALSASLSDSPSLDNSSATNVSQRKQECPGLPADSPSSEQNKDAVSKGLNPLSNLLSSLVAKGLISASKSETSSVLPPQIPNQKKKQSPIITNSSSTPPSSKSEKSPPLPPQNQSKKQSPIITNSSSTPPSSKSEKSSPLPAQNPNKSKAQSPSITKTKSTQASPVVSSEIPHKSTSDGISPPEPRDKSSQHPSVEIHNLIGLEFKPDVIREFHPPVISALCDDIPHQCSICGLRLKLREQFDRHMEWHTWKNSELEGVDKVTRRWYADSTDWIAGREGLPLELESSSSVDEIGRAMDVDEPVVPADEDQCVCVLCGELFEDHYCQRTNKWSFKGAMRLGLTSGVGDVEAINEDVKGPIAHVNCVSDRSLRDLGLASGEKNT